MMKLPMINGSVMRKLVGTALVGLMAVPFLAGCREKDKPKAGSLIPSYARRDGFGCVQGVIMNGFTGQRFDLSSLKEPDGIYALIRGQKLRAQFFRDDPNLMGEYYICDIPLDVTIPIFANITGFLPFEAQFSIASTRAIRVASTATSNSVAEDAPIADPILLGNFRLYPKGNGSRPLVINVKDDVNAVADAMVDLQPVTTAGQFAFDGDFFTNILGTRLVPTRKTTGADGVATFAASEIAYGTRYKLTVTPSAAQDLSAASRTTAFILGFGTGSTSNQDRNNWEFNIDLNDTRKALDVVACSSSNKTWNESGQVTIVLNRPVAFAAGVDQRDGWTASLTGSLSSPVAALADAVDNNNTSEKIEVSISGDGKIITLSPKAFKVDKKTPNYSLAKDNAQNKDVDLVIDYTINNIMLDVQDEDTVNAVSLASAFATMTDPQMNACKKTRFFKEY